MVCMYFTTVCIPVCIPVCMVCIQLTESHIPEAILHVGAVGSEYLSSRSSSPAPSTLAVVMYKHASCIKIRQCDQRRASGRTTDDNIRKWYAEARRTYGGRVGTEAIRT